MPSPEQLATVAREWICKADEDLRAATHLLKVGRIEKLIGLLPLDVVITLSVAEQRILTIYATITRYPGDYEPVTVKDARKAVFMARRVRRELRSLLPRGTRKHNHG